ncbi:unnamed protein product, partial [Rotaria sordida]
MNYLLFSLLILTIFISTLQALACYKHHDQCAYKPSCLVDANRKNCSSPEETYCYKDDIIFGMAIRGCAEPEFCNATIPIGTRHCCNTNYCNHAMKGIHITWIMTIIMPMTIMKFTESNWFVRVYDQACHRDTFDELNQTLYSCATDLNLALTVQNHFKGKQDEIDRHADREFLSKNFDKIIRLQSEYSQQHKVQLGNIERMFQSLVDNNKQNLEALMDDYKRQQMREEEKLFIHVQYSQVIFQQLIVSASSGNVYKGRWSNSKVVVKELKISAMKGQEREEFVKAVAILTRIRHENIVQHLGACIEEPDRYLVLSELMPLGSLNAILRNKELEFTWTDRWSIAKQITNAILYLHTYCSPPIIHKDIKSSNILLDYYGGDRRKYRAKVNDFGLDQIHGNVGTLAWSAPET